MAHRTRWLQPKIIAPLKPPERMASPRWAMRVPPFSDEKNCPEDRKEIRMYCKASRTRLSKETSGQKDSDWEILWEQQKPLEHALLGHYEHKKVPEIMEDAVKS